MHTTVVATATSTDVDQAVTSACSALDTAIEAELGNWSSSERSASATKGEVRFAVAGPLEGVPVWAVVASCEIDISFWYYETYE